MPAGTVIVPADRIVTSAEGSVLLADTIDSAAEGIHVLADAIVASENAFVDTKIGIKCLADTSICPEKSFEGLEIEVKAPEKEINLEEMEMSILNKYFQI